MYDLDNQDTIVAPATPPGEGGVGILRLSGSQAESLLRRLFVPSRPPLVWQSHRLYHGRILTTTGEVVDEVLAVVMRGPHSYTREDVAEVHCHGGSAAMRRLLDLFIDAGARLARPGEFTFRAFLHGRLDLVQAEAVVDIIRCASDSAHRIAIGQLEGKLSTVIHHFRDAIVAQLALVEIHIDFPEEDIDFPDRSRIATEVSAVLSEIERLLLSFDAGRAIREGLSLLILGKPNVGKSTLMNALLGEERVIVTPLPGTTRDLIEENFSLGGLPLRLIDTAGLRETSDPIEREGVRRAREKIAAADLILFVIDASAPLDADDLLAAEACRDARVVIVFNKSDCGMVALSPISDRPAVPISARNGEGMEELRRLIRDIFLHPASAENAETVLLADRRHRQALLNAREALLSFGRKIEDNVSPEFLALELRSALQAFGEITGETTPDAILEQIFSRFCIGK